MIQYAKTLAIAIAGVLCVFTLWQYVTSLVSTIEALREDVKQQSTVIEELSRKQTETNTSIYSLINKEQELSTEFNLFKEQVQNSVKNSKGNNRIVSSNVIDSLCNRNSIYGSTFCFTSLINDKPLQETSTQR